jgi:hypothetical protein
VPFRRLRPQVLPDGDGPVHKPEGCLALHDSPLFDA